MRIREEERCRECIGDDLFRFDIVRDETLQESGVSEGDPPLKDSRELTSSVTPLRRYRAPAK